MKARRPTQQGLKACETCERHTRPERVAIARQFSSRKTARRRSFCSEALNQATWNAPLLRRSFTQPPASARYLCSASAVCEVPKLFSDQEFGKRCLRATTGRPVKSHPTSSNSVKVAQGARCCRQRQSDNLVRFTAYAGRLYTPESAGNATTNIAVPGKRSTTARGRKLGGAFWNNLCQVLLTRGSVAGSLVWVGPVPLRLV
jgi:hypothetical protein